jgi:hypothetical protein
MLRPKIHAPTFGEAALRKIVVDADRSAVLAVHRPERPRCERPFVQSQAAVTDRIFDILIRARAESVDGKAEAETYLGHRPVT